MVDAQQLHAALLNGFNPLQALRKGAEDYLDAAEAQPGFVGSLYQVVASEEVQLHIRQAAAIRLKRMVDAVDWNHARSKVSAEEKAMLKGSLLATICTTPPLVRGQLLEVLRHILDYDFPAQWPELAPSITEMLQSNDLTQTRGALCALRKLTKRYEYYEPGSERMGEAYQMAAAYFPLLLQLFQHVNSQSATQTADQAYFQKLLLKIFYSLSHSRIPDGLRDDTATLNAWMTCIGQVLSQPVEPAAQGDMASACWKAKKWTGHVLQHILSKYGKPKMVKEEYKAFAQGWCEQYAGGFIEPFLNLIAARHAGQAIPDQVLSRSICYIDSCMNRKSLYKLLQPRLDALLQQQLFPLLCFNADDVELWESNPQEYVRKTYCCDGMLEDFYNPRLATINFLKGACEAPKNYHDKGLFVRYLNFLSALLQQVTGKTDAASLQQKYGAVTAVGTLRRMMVETGAVSAQVEPLLAAHIFPDYANPCGFLRSNALWCTSRFANKIDWQSAAHFSTALEANMRLMRDPDMPVRVQAGLALRYIITNKKAVALVRPVLGEVVQACFSLMDQIDVEQLVETLEIVIGRYGEEMQAQAAMLCERLSVHFLKITRGGSGDDVDLETISTGACCLQAIKALVLACSENPTVVRQLQLVCRPLCLRLLQPDCGEYVDDAMGLISHLTMCCNGVEPAFWEVFPAMYANFESFSHNNFEMMLAPLDNFVCRDPAAFVRGAPAAGVSYTQLMYKMCKFCLEHEDFNETEYSTAPKLIESMLQHCKAHRPGLDEALPSFFDIALHRLVNPGTRMDGTPRTTLKILLCGTFFNGLWYSTPLTLQYLEAKGITANFFDEFKQVVPEITRVADKKVICLGMTSLLEYSNSGAQLPAYFTQDCMKGIVQLIIRFVLENWQANVERDQEGSVEEEEIDSDDEDGCGALLDGGDSDDEENALTTDADATLEKMCRKAKEMEARGETHYDSAIYDFDDDEEVWSVIDEVSEAEFFAQQLAQIRGRAPQLLEALIAGVPEDKLEKLQEAHEYGTKKAAEVIQHNREQQAGG